MTNLETNQENYKIALNVLECTHAQIQFEFPKEQFLFWAIDFFNF